MIIDDAACFFVIERLDAEMDIGDPCVDILDKNITPEYVSLEIISQSRNLVSAMPKPKMFAQDSYNSPFIMGMPSHPKITVGIQSLYV